MKQNLFFAFFWAVVGVLTAILIKLLFSIAGPMLSIAMIVSTIMIFVLTAKMLISSFEKDDEN